MRKRFIYICSPCRGDMEKNITKAQGYCREAAELWPDVVPIAPHVYCTQFLDDTVPAERAVGMDMGLALLDMCDELWVYGIKNPSEGMKCEIAYAEENGIPVRDAAEIYGTKRHENGTKQEENGTEQEYELGDAILKLPPHVNGVNGVAVVESTALHISGEVIVDLAKQLRRHRGHDMELEAEA